MGCKICKARLTDESAISGQYLAIAESQFEAGFMEVGVGADA